MVDLPKQPHMTYKAELHRNVREALRTSPLTVALLGADGAANLAVYYGMAPPNHRFPYVVVEVNQQWGSRDRTVNRGKLFVDVWDYDESGLRAEGLVSVVERVLHTKRVLGEDLQACRLEHDYSIILPVEKIDGAVDHRVHHIQVIFTYRLVSLEKIQAILE